MEIYEERLRVPPEGLSTGDLFRLMQKISGDHCRRIGYGEPVMEELGLTVRSVHFNRSHYYAKSNTLMLNFTVTVDEVDPHPNWEVDSWRWFSVEEARQMIRPASLAQVFLNGYLDGEYHFETFIPDK